MKMQTKRVAVFLRTILHVWFRSKIDLIETFKLQKVGVALMYFFVKSQNKDILRNLNHY